MFSESYSKIFKAVMLHSVLRVLRVVLLCCGTRLQWLAQQMHNAIEHGLPKLALWSTHDSNLVHLRTSWHTMQYMQN